MHSLNCPHWPQGTGHPLSKDEGNPTFTTEQQKDTTKEHEEDTASQAGSKWTREGSAKEESLQLGFGERGEHLCLVTGGQAEQAKEKHGEGTRAYRAEENGTLAGGGTLHRRWYGEMRHR